MAVSICVAPTYDPPMAKFPDGFLWGHPLVHIGPLARTVADAALMTKIMAGPHSRDPFSLPEDGVDYVGAAGGPSKRASANKGHTPKPSAR